MSDWEILRRQVAIGGTVSDPSGAPLDRVEVSVRPKAAEIIRERFYTRPDGTYFFLDLPDGEFVVSARWRDLPATAEAVVSRDTAGTIQMHTVDLRFVGAGSAL